MLRVRGSFEPGLLGGSARGRSKWLAREVTRLFGAGSESNGRFCTRVDVDSSSNLLDIPVPFSHPFQFPFVKTKTDSKSDFSVIAGRFSVVYFKHHRHHFILLYYETDGRATQSMQDSNWVVFREGIPTLFSNLNCLGA